MKDEAGQNSLNDLIASGGLPEATPVKTREQLEAKISQLRELASHNLDEREKLIAERDAAYIRGLERAKEIAHDSTELSLKMRALEFARVSATIEDRIQAEIAKAKAGK